MVGQHLPRAYRSRPRPSSALGAKASTVCSYSLDQKEHVVLSLWSFQGARRKPVAPVSQNSTAWNAEVDVLLGELGHRTIEPKLEHQRAERLPE